MDYGYQSCPASHCEACTAAQDLGDATMLACASSATGADTHSKIGTECGVLTVECQLALIRPSTIVAHVHHNIESWPTCCLLAQSHPSMAILNCCDHSCVAGHRQATEISTAAGGRGVGHWRPPCSSSARAGVMRRRRFFHEDRRLAFKA